MDLTALARQARAQAYAPYSNFLVGCAIECQDGSIYTGVNVENASFGATVCAERVAILKAVSEGQRHFQRLAICSGASHLSAPCGLCRQVIAEFCAPDLAIILCNADPQAVPDRILRFGDLYPEPFHPASLL
jgi:cytidine deaminase